MAGAPDWPWLQLRVSPRVLRAFCPVRTLPAKLRLTVGGVGLPRGVVRGGWDRTNEPLEAHPTYRLMATLLHYEFERDACFEPLVRYYIARGRGPAAARAHARQRIDTYLRDYARLADDLLARGYRAEPGTRQIGAAIDRAGGWLKVQEGHHRFALACLRELDSVVVDLRWMHARWYRAFAAPGRSPGAVFRCAAEAAVERAGSGAGTEEAVGAHDPPEG